MPDVDQFWYADRLFYAPWRVRAILRSLRYAIDRPRATEPNVRRRGQRIEPNAWLEERIIERGDVLRSLTQLPWFSRQIVYRAFVLDQSDSHLATVLRCDRETVRRHKEDGVDLMARRLGWEGESPRPQKRSPTVWRHPELEQRRP
jgi:DNA-directed RNA polymerase specialized sigma24 family protein